MRRASGTRAGADAAPRSGACAPARRAGAAAGPHRPRRAPRPRPRTRRPRPASGAGTRASRLPRSSGERRGAAVHDQPALGDAALHLVVGDDERLVVLADPTAPERRVHVRVIRGGGSRDVLRECLPWSSALCAVWASERSGKWKHSIGNHPRSGAKGLSTSAWLPRVTWISGCPRWTTFRIGL